MMRGDAALTVFCICRLTAAELRVIREAKFPCQVSSSNRLLHKLPLSEALLGVNQAPFGATRQEHWTP